MGFPIRHTLYGLVSIMACAALVQPLFEGSAARGATASDLSVKTAGFSGFYSKVQHRWAARLVSGSLFEPTQLELDRRDRAERLLCRLHTLRSERVLRKSLPRFGIDCRQFSQKSPSSSR